MASTMKAIKVHGPKNASVIRDAKVPSLRPDYVLVKTSCIALNPTDWKHIDFLASEGATVGCDYSGTVVEVGKDVKKDFKKGDRIAGFTHGVNATQAEDGAFGEYLVAKGDVQMKVPDNVSDEEAATLGVGISTIGQGMYQSLGLPWPNEATKEKIPLLIYGGSTATGLFALQFAKLSNLTVITTCSPHNFELVKSLGADAAFDYSDPKCAQNIREYTNNNLKHAFDCISENSSPQICCDSLSTTGGAYSSLLPVHDFPRKDVTNNATLAYTIKGEDIKFRGTPIPGQADHFDFGVRFWAVAEKLLQEGKFKCLPDVRKGGLDGAFGGLDDLRNGKVSGKKLVYKVSETS